MKLSHESLADYGARNFLFSPLLETSFDTVSNRFYSVDTHGTLFARSLQTVDNLDPVVAFSSTVFLDHQRHHLLHPFISSKATVTMRALSPTPDHIVVFAQSRVDNTIICLMAEVAFHAGYPTCGYIIAKQCGTPCSKLYYANCRRESSH